jgi:hypothetical protein
MSCMRGKEGGSMAGGVERYCDVLSMLSSFAEMQVRTDVVV